MGTPTNRTPVRVARGTYSNLNTNKADIQGSEIVYATDQNKLYVKEGSDLIDAAPATDISGKADIASPTFTGTVAIPNIANVETAITGKADLAGATFTGDIVINADSKKLKLGAGSDLELYHDGSNSYIADVGTGELRIRGTTVRITDNDGTESFAIFNDDGAVELYHNNSKKFETTSSGVTVTGAAVPASITALTDGATIATDLALNNNYSVTLAGNRTLGQPTNQTVGQSGSIFVTQDGTGSRTLAYHADWKWAGGTAPTLSTAAASVDRIDYIVAAANKIHAVATLAVA